MEKILKPECAFCKVEVRVCRSPEGSGPTFCPTQTRGKEIQAAKEKYQEEGVMRFAKNASLQEAECYARRDERPFVRRPTKTRVEETVEFAKKMGYKKLGVAFCAGLFSEARTFVEILRQHGFDVVSVCCKVGGVPKEFLGLRDHEKVKEGAQGDSCNHI